jgi:uracil-DNA glycosylase
LLLGNNAKSKIKLIDKKKHKIITGIHPSPLSANKGFFGSNIFKTVNNELIKLNKNEIIW